MKNTGFNDKIRLAMNDYNKAFATNDIFGMKVAMKRLNYYHKKHSYCLDNNILPPLEK